MKTASQSSPARRAFNVPVWPIALVVLAVAFAPVAGGIARVAAQADLTQIGFDAALWARQDLALQIHVASAGAALAIGLAIFALPKGRLAHRALGWSWVLAMAGVTVSSLFMTGLNGDFYSLIHLLSGWALVGLPMGVYAARRRDLRQHRSAMTGLFTGGLLLAGALSFIPGRFMWALFFGG